MTAPFSFFDVVPDLAPLRVVDVGALPMSGLSETYTPLMEQGNAIVTGFEADAAGCRALTEKHGPPHRFLPFVIGDGKSAVFHRNTEVMTSSLYQPNMSLISRFTNLEGLVVPESREPVQTHTLDEVVDWDDIDFLKMDVQGAELSVLEGCARVLPNTLVVQTEVEFVEIYHDQPLFADIDRHLRDNGFQFHTFLGFGQRPYKTGDSPAVTVSQTRQVLWSDAVYVPDVTALDKLTDERLLRLAAVLHDLYTSVDLVLHVLAELAERGKPEVRQRYVTVLQAAKS